MNSSTTQQILNYLRKRQQDMTDTLTRIVELESPSDNKDAIDRLGSYLAWELRGLDAQVEILEQEKAGDHLLARWGEGEGGALLLCHMDTVWPLGTLKERPVRIEDGKLYGPGADDMKGGIVITLYAMRALQELNLMPKKRITLIINSDEEVGTVTSRAAIEEQALQHDVVFVMEPPVPPGALKTQRKGVGEFHVRVTGLATHAGADHAKGVNAIEELARQIQVIQGFTDYESGTTLNVGVVGGGTRSNVVPAEAWAEVDVRIVKAEEGPKIIEKMKSLKPFNPKAALEVSGGINRPPMERSPQIVALFEQAREIGASMGLELMEASTGGGSDGNFTAALGVPTLDGMGVVGDGGHALSEHAVLSSLPERAAVLAGMLLI